MTRYQRRIIDSARSLAAVVVISAVVVMVGSLVVGLVGG